jgi:hypothetical protein
LPTSCHAVLYIFHRTASLALRHPFPSLDL